MSSCRRFSTRSHTCSKDCLIRRVWWLKQLTETILRKVNHRAKSAVSKTTAMSSRACRAPTSSTQGFKEKITLWLKREEALSRHTSGQKLTILIPTWLHPGVKWPKTPSECLESVIKSSYRLRSPLVSKPRRASNKQCVEAWTLMCAIRNIGRPLSRLGHHRPT